MMMKRTIFQSALLFAIMLVSSVTVCAVNPVAYIGGKLGYGITDSEVNVDAPRQVFGSKDKSNLSGRGIDGGILLGTGCFFGMNESFFLGVDLSGSLSNISGNSSRDTGIAAATNRICFKKKNDLEALLKAGFVIREGAMPFLLVGVTTAQFELKSEFPPGGGIKPSATIKNRHTGLILGLGIDIAVTPCLDIGIQGTHRRYNSKSYTHELIAGAQPAVYRVKPKSNELHVTAKWKFYQGRA